MGETPKGSMIRDIKTNNNVWENKGLNPLVGYNFMLRVEGVYDLPCKSIKSFSREMEYEIIQEGGLNDYVHMSRKPISKPFFLEVERYVGVDYLDPMPNGANIMLPVILFISQYNHKMFAEFAERSYVFTGCTVTKKTYGELDSEKSALLTETTTLAYREMLCIDINDSIQYQGNDVG